MKGLSVMLKALGISLSPEHIQAVQELVPVLPQKLNEAWQIIHNTLTSFAGRLEALENQNKRIIELLEAQDNARRTNTRNPGDGIAS